MVEKSYSIRIYLHNQKLLEIRRFTEAGTQSFRSLLMVRL